MRHDSNGKVLRRVELELPNELYRRLEQHKASTGQPMHVILRDWVTPHLQQLPVHPPRRRIES